MILFTGYGICGASVTIALALFLLWRSDGGDRTTGRWPAALCVLFFAAAVLAFAHGYRWDHATTDQHPLPPRAWDYPRFGALMFTSLLGLRRITAFTIAAGSLFGGLVIAGFFTSAWRLWRSDIGAAKPVWILTGTVLIYVALTTYGRLRTSIEAAFMWRYLTLMTCAAVGLALTIEFLWLARKDRMRPWFMSAWLLLAGVIWADFKPEAYAAAVAEAKRRWIQAYLKTHDLPAANRAADFWVYYPAPDSPVIAERLRWLEAHHLSFFREQPGTAEPPPTASKVSP